MATEDPTTALARTRICDLGLTVEGSTLGPVVAEFLGELERAGVRKVRPRFYLSTEWGVNEGTVSVGIPFYLARADLIAYHVEHVGHVEGVGRVDLLRYLRHETGHVVNYAYELFRTPEWVETFGPMDLPYLDEFRLEPFSRRFVRHLPGWYAQKHPDEDWSETFAVWLTPGRDWHAEYADWPVALGKLQYVDRTLAALADRDPPVTADPLDQDVSTLTETVGEFYAAAAWPGPADPPGGLDAALLAVFEPAADDGPDRMPASSLVRAVERDLAASVYHWTGHFPERTRPLLRHLAARADALGLTYPRSGETAAAVGLTALVTALAMNHVERGAYLV